MERKRVLSYAAVVLIAACALVLFWPGTRYESVTKFNVTQDQMIPAEKAGAEALKILDEGRHLSAKGELTADNMFEMQKRMKRLSVYAEQYGPHPRPGMIFWDGASMSQLAGIRDGNPNFRNISREEFDRYRNLFNTDPEWLALDAFRPSTTTDNKQAVMQHYICRYIITIPIGVIVCVLLMLRGNMPLGYALAKVFNHPFLMALYPFGIILTLLAPYVSSREYRQEIKRLVSWMSYATAASISVFFGGTASAQTLKKDEKKKTAGYSLQLDTRVIVPIEGPPPTLFNRTTLNAEAWLAESITTATPETGAWYNETGIGAKIVKTQQTTVSGISIVSNDSSGTRKVMLGAQYFRAGPMGVIAVPVARVEKMIDGPTAVAAAANPFFRLGREGTPSRLALSPDVFVRKTFGKPLAWTAGLGLDFFTRKGKGDRVEAALLKNSSNQWQVRGRYIHNFAF